MIILDESSLMVAQRNLNKPESKTAQKKRLIKEKQTAKHCVKEQCSCPKLCPLKVSHERRLAINNTFNKYGPVEQKLYIRSRTNILRRSRNDQRIVTEYFLNNERDE